MKWIYDIKGWRERAGLPADFKLFFATAVEQALLDEVAELRALLNPPEEITPIGKDPRQLDILEAIDAAAIDPAKP